MCKSVSRLSSGKRSQQSCLLRVSTGFLPCALCGAILPLSRGCAGTQHCGTSSRLFPVAPAGFGDTGFPCEWWQDLSGECWSCQHQLAASYFPQDAPSLSDFGEMGSRWRRDTCLKQLACAGRGFLRYRLPALASHGPLCSLDRALKVLL